MTTPWTNVGNVQDWGITPNPTVIKHKNTQGGIKRVDRVDVSQYEVEFDMKVDEWVSDNLKLGLLAVANTAGVLEIGVAAITRQVKFVGANQIGPQWTVILPNVFFAAKERIQLLGGDDYMSIPLSGYILYNQVAGNFGTMFNDVGQTAPLATPNDLNDYLGTGSVFTAPVGT